MLISRISNRKLSILCERVGVAFDVGQDPYRIFDREAGDGRTNHGRHMKSVADHVRQGCSLTEAVHLQGNYFPPNFNRLIDVGERSGRLEKVLDRMSIYYKDMADLRDEFINSITWPLIQLFLGLMVISVLIYVPSILSPEQAEVADLLGIGLIGLSGLATFWAWILGIAAVFVALFLLIRNGRLAFLGNLFTRVPVVGRALLAFDEATFIQSLSLAIESGVNASTAVALAFRTSSSAAFKAKAEQAEDAINQGREMHAVLDDTGLFSKDTIEAVQLGEESGRLAETLDKHYRVLQMKVRFAMATFTQIASSAIWIVISALLITIIFRIFTRYVSSVSPDAVQNMFNRGAP